MARSSTSDPLEKFRFLVEWDSDSANEPTSLARAGFFEVAMPKRNTNKISYREGNDPDISMLSAGLSTMEDITLTRGLISLSTEANNSFYLWMSAVHKPTSGISGLNNSDNKKAGTVIGHAATDYRKTIRIKVLDRTGAVARVYELQQAFPVSFIPGSDMSAAEDGDKMLESLTLAYEDFKELKPSDSATEVEVSAAYTA